ncbi:MAG: hypothetical protein LLG37_07270 [Spirochaetia bacterium]|nr:hypothetical protein [Spirochaetia bacterium]
MFFKFADYTFEGPYASARFLFNKPGVYVVLCKDIKEDGKYYLLDVAESGQLQQHAMNSENKVGWMKNCHGVGTLAIAVNYMERSQQIEREKIVKHIRSLYDVPCK